MARTRRPAVDTEAATVLDEVASRVVWIATRMIHEANVLRPHPDGLKVGGHQASSASVASILTVLYLRWLDPQDLVAVKPHASPAYHAVQYLLGALPPDYLPRLREFGGLQAYPSRTKDPDRVDFSTGSVGLGGIAPLFAALAGRYVKAQFPDAETRAGKRRRYVALVGDAELDEGSVWEAVTDESVRNLGEVTLIVDLNRQSLDRVVPGVRASRLKALFDAAGWHVLEAKYGRQLEATFQGPGGEALRLLIDDMDNEAYQRLIRRPGAEARAWLVERAAPDVRDRIRQAVSTIPDERLTAVLGDLGGHDPALLEATLRLADRDPRPSVVFAYTIKGWRLPFAGDTFNHSALLTQDQIDRLAGELGANAAEPWAAFAPDSPAGRLCTERGLEFREAPASRAGTLPDVPDELDVRIPPAVSSQAAFGDALATLAREPIGNRIVTTSPDVSVSTNLGGWINRVGVFGASAEADGAPEASLTSWRTSPEGRHIELGISESNLFMLLSQLGLAGELHGERLVPIGTVYDPFICRGLDALIYGLYSGARFIVVGTPSGIALAPEGGAHQSFVTPSLGIELPGLRMYEPVFADEVAWTLLESVRGAAAAEGGFSSYLRLTTRLIDQRLREPVVARLGQAAWRRDVLAGGYSLLTPEDAEEPLPAGSPRVTIAASGAVVPEAVEATRWLHREEVAADLVVVTSAERLATELDAARLAAVRIGRRAPLGHVERLLGSAGRRTAPLVTVLDGHPHALAFLGGAYGVPVVPLGVTAFGQSGTIDDLFASAGIDAAHIGEAALAALELAEDWG